MKFQIKKDTLRAELKFINKIADKKAVIPSLAHVLLDTTNDNLKMTATDLDVSIVSKIEAQVSEKGKCTVNAWTLNKIVSVCQSEILFELKQNRLHISSGKAKWTLATFEANQFPELSPFTPEVFKISFNLFRSMVNKTKIAITREPSRFTLSGAKLIIGNDRLTLVATDGHRLALAESEIKTKNVKLDGLIYFDAVILIDSMTKIESIGISDDLSHWYFYLEHRTVIARKLSGQFPNYEAVVPKHNSLTARLDIIALKEALKQAVITADRDSIKWQFGDGILTILSRQEEGFFETNIVCSGDANGVTCGFNGNYLLDYCKVVGSGVCEMSLQHSNTQTIFEVKDKSANERFRYILMPLRV